jgi:type VI secretion system protein ImpH
MTREPAIVDPALEELLDQPWRFEFQQAIRVLLRNSDHGRNEHGQATMAVDRRYDVTREPVRIGAHQSLGFPASDIQALSRTADRDEAAGRPEAASMLLNCFGLTGPSGVLPLAYTEFLIEREAERDAGPSDFLNIFNHRLAMLFYYAWEKYRFQVIQESRPNHDLFTRILLSLSGLGTDYLRGRQFTPDTFFARYAALLAIQPRSASALQTILADFFQVQIEVRQFAGNWYQLDEGSRTCFRAEEDRSDSERLGYGVVVSEEYWSQEFMVRLRIGPLDLESYKRFLRGGADLRMMEEICRFFSRDELVFELQLVLHSKEVPGTRLSVEESVNDSRLGWTTWAKSEPFEKDAEDVVFRLS